MAFIFLFVGYVCHGTAPRKNGTVIQWNILFLNSLELFFFFLIFFNFFYIKSCGFLFLFMVLSCILYISTGSLRAFNVNFLRSVNENEKGVGFMKQFYSIHMGHFQRRDLGHRHIFKFTH